MKWCTFVQMHVNATLLAQMRLTLAGLPLGVKVTVVQWLKNAVKYTKWLDSGCEVVKKPNFLLHFWCQVELLQHFGRLARWCKNVPHCFIFAKNKIKIYFSKNAPFRLYKRRPWCYYMLDIVRRAKDESNFQRPASWAHWYLCFVGSDEWHKVRQRNSQVHISKNE